MRDLYPGATKGGALVHLTPTPDARDVKALCGWLVWSGMRPVTPEQRSSACAKCVRIAAEEDARAERSCVGCFRSVRRGHPEDHAQGCPTGQNGTPNYE